MWKKLSMVVLVLMATFVAFYGFDTTGKQIAHSGIGESVFIDISTAPMPVFKTALPEADFGTPVEKRSESVRYYLRSTVLVANGNKAGSGVICYYDPAHNDAYVLSCGHLFSGNKLPDTGLGTNTVDIHTFYKNNTQLSQPHAFKGEVVCYNSKYDISVIKFKPDWTPQSYFAIAPLTYHVRQGDVYESTGCDLATAPASYTVQVVIPLDERGTIVTQKNSPREGRSGGGLLSPEGYHLGIVQATSAVDGSGYGFYVPTQKIHEYLSKYPETRMLLNVPLSGSPIGSLPVIDSDGRAIKLPNGYLPQP